MNLKKALGKKSRVKAFRRVFGPKKQIIIDIKGKQYGLKKSEIKEVINGLKDARDKREIPSISFEYRKVFISGREPIFIKPKTNTLKHTASRVRLAIRKRFGSKYRVGLF